MKAKRICIDIMLELLGRLLVLSAFMKLLYAMYLIMLEKLGIFFIAIGIAKFIYAMYLKHKQK